MKKIILVGMVVMIMFGVFVYAACEDYDKCGTQEDRAGWLKKNIGIDVTGSNFVYNGKSTPPSFIITEGSTAKIPVDFTGTVKVVGTNAVVKIGEDITFSGVGTYSSLKGFDITNGVFNGIAIANGNSVTYNKNANEIRGFAGADCKVNNGDINEGNEFVIKKGTKEGEKEITVLGKPGLSTVSKLALKNGDYWLGDSKLNTKDSKLYLKPGDVLNIEGLAAPLIAEKRTVRIDFKEGDAGYTIVPTIKELLKYPEDVPANVNKNSVVDMLKFLGYPSDKDARGIKFEEICRGSADPVCQTDYTGSSEQNKKILDSIKQEFYYNEKKSNVQIRVLNENPKAVTSSQLPPDLKSEAYGKSYERFLANENLRAIDERLDSIKIPGTFESIREAAIRLTNEHNADPNTKALVDVKTVLSKILAESTVGINAINKGAGDRISRGLLQVSESAVNELNNQYKNEFKTDINKYNIDEVNNNPETNLRVGIEYYALMLNKCGGDEKCALAAYNIGEGKTINLFKKTGNIPPGAKPHVAKVLGAKHWYENWY